MDRYFVELNNTVESSLRLIEHLATEPERAEADGSLGKRQPINCCRICMNAIPISLARQV